MKDLEMSRKQTVRANLEVCYGNCMKLVLHEADSPMVWQPELRRTNWRF